MEVPIFLKLRMLWNGPLRNLATQPVSWPVKIETALQFLENVLLESNYHHTQDNAVIVITKATSVLHLINLKKKLFYTKFLTSDKRIHF
jgi:hypothetical protein